MQKNSRRLAVEAECFLALKNGIARLYVSLLTKKKVKSTELLQSTQFDYCGCFDIKKQAVNLHFKCQARICRKKKLLYCMNLPALEVVVPGNALSSST